MNKHLWNLLQQGRGVLQLRPWNEAFTHQLQTLLQITPAAVRFPWANFRIQGYSPSEAIAYLIQTHRLYPELRLLPMPAPKFGIGDAVVWHGKGDRIVEVRWWESTDFHWSYRVENSFGRGSRSNAWYGEDILEPLTEDHQENFAEVS